MSRSALAVGVRYLRGVVAAERRNDEDDEQLLHAFLSHRDEAAFAALVRRHGPMVLGVCRRVLGHQQDAEDAFQTTFLALARRAAALRKKTALASFLHGTAYHLASKVKRAAARRRKHEGLAPTRTPDNPAGELLWREVQALLDDEIARLPDAYRSVFVLCCLESLSRAEAARRLGLKEGTVSSRLAEARRRLQQRLARRGVELTALLAATALATPPASALPPVLWTNTIHAALSLAVVALTGNGSSLLGFGKAKLTAALVLALSILSGAGLWAYREEAVPAATASPPPAKEKAERPQVPNQAEKDGPTVEVSGRVLDPDGKPVRGAKLLFLYPSGKKHPHKVWATSDAEGRFVFGVLRSLVDNGYSESPWQDTHVLAAADGYGFAATKVGKPGAADLTLRLVKDGVPLRGRILDLQGKPIAGAHVHIDGMLSTPANGDLTAWLAALKANKEDPNNVDWAHLTRLQSTAFDLLFPPVTTGTDGRFVITGIGRERVARLRIEGSAIATQALQVMTRPGDTLYLPEFKHQPKGPVVTYCGSPFDLAVAPTRPIVGVVRDKDTGKPLAGVTVESKLIAHSFQVGFLRTTTDKDGRYQFVGLPKGDGSEIAATTDDRPYLPAVEKVPNPRGLEPIAIDFALKRGVWVGGRVTNKATGKPLWAGVEYFCFRDNPSAKEIRLEGNVYNWRSTQEDGLFRIPVLPGRGLLTVWAYHDHYLMGVGAEQIKGGRLQESPDFFDTVPYFFIARNAHTLVEIAPKAGEDSITCDVTLVPGHTLKGKVLDPDGKPLAGALVSGLKDLGYWMDIGSDFTVESLQPDKPRVLQFVHDGKKLAGMVILRGDEKEPLSVRLEPSGTLTGRLVTPQGDPLAGTSVTCGAVLKEKGQALHPTALDVRTGKDGRFRIEGLKPGLKYGLGVTTESYVREIVGGEPKDLTVRAGETKDLGELRVKPME
jgi:RNA polymerase sigma factor (sigma-70 family)